MCWKWNQCLSFPLSYTSWIWSLSSAKATLYMSINVKVNPFVKIYFCEIISLCSVLVCKGAQKKQTICFPASTKWPIVFPSNPHPPPRPMSPHFPWTMVPYLCNPVVVFWQHEYYINKSYSCILKNWINCNWRQKNSTIYEYKEG